MKSLIPNGNFSPSPSSPAISACCQFVAVIRALPLVPDLTPPPLFTVGSVLRRIDPYKWNDRYNSYSLVEDRSTTVSDSIPDADRFPGRSSDRLNMYFRIRFFTWLLGLVLPIAGLARADEVSPPAEFLVAAEQGLPQAEPPIETAPSPSESGVSDPSEAEVPAPPGDSPALSEETVEAWNLEELMGFAESHHPTLVEASAWVDIALGNQTQVGLYPNPILYYNGANITKSMAGQQGGLVEQTIMTGKKLKLNRAVAAQTVNQATWLRQQQIYRVTNAVRLRYYEILGAQRRIELTESLLGLAEKGAEVTRKLQKSGEGTLTDVLQAEIEAGQAQVLLNNARNEYDGAWGQLSAALGAPGMHPVNLTGSLDEEAPDFEWNETYGWLLSNSPEVMVAQTSVSRARIAIRRAQVEPIPNLNFQGWVQRDTQVDQNIMQFQVGVPTPIFNRNQGGKYSAFAEYRRSVAAVEQVELSLKDRLAVAYRRYRNSSQQVENYRERILPKAQQSLELIREGYQRGELNFLQVLVAQRTYFQTSLAYIDSLTELWKSSVMISGMLLTEDSEASTIPMADAPRGL